MFQIDDQDLKISVTFKNLKNLIANANVCIETVGYGPVTIKGFQIWNSATFNERLQEKINITPPKKFWKGTYIDQLFFEDRQKWTKLESRIYDAYSLARNEKNSADAKNQDENKIKKIENTDETVNPEEIPF